MPTKVQNVTIAVQNSTSLLVQWSPPAQINGMLMGYNIKVLKNITVTSVYDDINN